MKRMFWLIGLMVVFSLAQAGELYRWVDDKGKVHYGDAPPPEVEVQEKKFHDPAASDAGLPYLTRRARQNFPVTLYVADNCTELCDRARELLTKRGIPFTERRLATQEEFNAFKAASGSSRLPTLSVGKAFIQGLSGGRWHEELDFAGYPKVAPYRPPSEPSPATLPAATKDEASAGNVAP